MSDDLCAICGQPSVDGHHLTGRGPHHTYLDPDLVVPLCHDDHELIHADLRHDGIDRPLRDGCVFVRVARRLERVAIFVARLAGQASFAWLGDLAASLRRWAGELNAGVAALDAWNPTWRQA